MPTLKISCAGSNPQSIDLSLFVQLGEDAGADPYDPAFTQRVFSRSLLKEGATLPLVQLVEKQQQWPLIMGPYANQSAMAAAIQQINQVLNTPGAVISWQDDGMSQPSYFDMIVGELQIAYSYRKAQRSYTKAKLLTFSQPLGRTAGPRPYATASAVGPLLMISPYASSGALAIGASTQGGVAGFGGQQQGASSGVFYWGNPSLAGDATAELQISYVGPLPAGATAAGVAPYVAVSLLPDALYQPLITAPQITFANLNNSTARHLAQTSVASSYITLSTSGADSVIDRYSFYPITDEVALEPTVQWSGQHRLFAIARASSAGAPNVSATLVSQAGPLVQGNTSAQIAPVGLDWGLYDMGTFALRASQYPQAQIQVQAVLDCVAGASAALDLAAFAMLPDATTWLMNPTRILPAQYGYPPNLASPWGAPPGAWSNTILVDDTLGDQFLYYGQAQAFAPSPIGAVPSCTRMTQFTRGLVPRPDPKTGLPIIAILGVGQPADAAIGAPISFATYSTGPQSVGSAADASGVGTVSWSNAGGLTSSGAAFVSLVSLAQSHYLKAMSYGFSIPSGAAIIGIQVVITRLTTASVPTAYDAVVSLVKAGTVQSTNRASGAIWPTSYQAATYGSPTDLWGGTWASTDINASNFGTALSVNGGANGGQENVTAMTVQVYYTFGTPPVSFPGASQANPQNLRTMAQVNVQERTRYVLA